MNVDDSPEHVGDRAEHLKSLNFGHVAEILHSDTELVSPDGAVRVQHDFNNGWIVHSSTDSLTHLAAQFVKIPPVHFVRCLAHVVPSF